MLSFQYPTPRDDARIAYLPDVQREEENIATLWLRLYGDA